MSSARRAPVLLAGLGLCCSAPPAEKALGHGQAPALSWLVLHVEPLPRGPAEDCAEAGLVDCGGPVGKSWEGRVENLAWLAEAWAGRAVDLQLGPEMAESLLSDPGLMRRLAADLEANGGLGGQRYGAAEAEARVSALAAEGQASLGAMLEGGDAQLGLHVHRVLRDSDKSWGDAARVVGEGAEACAAWSGAPAADEELAAAEAVLSYGARAVGRLAEQLDRPLWSATGHLPRTMGGKINAQSEPQGIDPAVESDFGPAFSPLDLGSAYSECLFLWADHPPYEPWRADAEQALLADEGPLVLPGERPLGLMDEHFGAPADSSLPASARRLLGLALEWRRAALAGEEARPWIWSFHTHDSQIGPGEPDPARAADRELAPVEGNALRAELLGMAELVEDMGGDWQGLEGPVLRWGLPSEVEEEGSRFSYGAPGIEPSADLEAMGYPYSAELARGLSDSHLVCRGAVGGLELWGLRVCEGGWSWGGGSPGQHCSSGEAPTQRWVLVPEAAGCVELPGLRQVWRVEEDEELLSCGSGQVVPAAGLVVELNGEPPGASACAPWPR